MHDLGHGPFSHMWDHVVHPVHPEWSHEEMSANIIRNIFREDNIRLSADVDEHERGVNMIVAYVKYDINELNNLLPTEELFLSEVRNACVERETFF